MIANFIFHFIFAVFLVWGLIAWIYLHKKLASFKFTLIPILCQKHLFFPKHRSLFVRAIHCISEEITQLTTKKVKFQYVITEQTKLPIEILHPFALFFTKQQDNGSKIFYYQNGYFTFSELLFKIKPMSDIKIIRFVLAQDNSEFFYWTVETLNV